MESIQYFKTERTPFVSLNPNGEFKVSGISIPEDSTAFYKPVLAWLDSYCKSPQPETNAHFVFDYFNTSSSKDILEIFKMLGGLNDSGKSKVCIKWEFEDDDDDIRECGEDYQSIIGVAFEMIEIAV
ncbi:MAG: DUF1987 domain-containing protein [Flavobacteriales bacterium]|nr:DUF1987 domain-containing protein [Flavobacteriales bacterium]